MAKKEFDPNQFGGFVPGNLTRGSTKAVLNPAQRRAAERAANAPSPEEVETPTTPDAVPEKGKE